MKCICSRSSIKGNWKAMSDCTFTNPMQHCNTAMHPGVSLMARRLRHLGVTGVSYGGLIVVILSVASVPLLPRDQSQNHLVATTMVSNHWRRAPNPHALHDATRPHTHWSSFLGPR